VPVSKKCAGEGSLLNFDTKLAKDAYALTIIPAGAKLRGGSYAALAMGTREQFASAQKTGDAVSLPAMEVEDSRVEYDGIMVRLRPPAQFDRTLKQCVMLCHIYRSVSSICILPMIRGLPFHRRPIQRLVIITARSMDAAVPIATSSTS